MIARLVLAALLALVLDLPRRSQRRRASSSSAMARRNAWRLCGVGQKRAAALAANYLGRNAAKSLFAGGEEPAAFLAITCTRSSLRRRPTWSLPLTLYAAPPGGEKRHSR